MATLAELLNAPSADGITDALIGELQAGDFPTTDWSSGAPERTFVEAEGASQLGLWELAPKIAGGGHIDLATGDWLTLLALNRYNLTRIAAVAAVGTEVLTCSASAGPYTIAIGQLQFIGAGGNLYRNTAGGVLNTSGTLSVTIAAESPGADQGNDGADTIVAMTTPLGGVTCTNPADTFSDVSCSGIGTGTVTPSFGTLSTAAWVVEILTTGQRGTATFRLSNDGGLTFGTGHATAASVVDIDGTGLTIAFANGGVNPSYVAGDFYTFTSQGTWYTTQGSDEESDASLRQRCKARWPEQSSTPTDDVYTAMCKRASASVTKVRVAADLVTPAQVNIVIAGPNGTVSAGVVDVVQAYVDARQAFTDVPVVAAAGTMAITLAGATVRVKSENYANAVTRAQANIATYLGTCAIGDGSTKKVRYSQILEAILRESGDEDDSVDGLTLNGGTSDLVITDAAVVTWAQRIATAVSWATY